ncbi:MAG: FG-GAP-like repeat-containing protein, partial [Cytophagaceae bacterium]|nr:FG-GAP-like repeat-containing protein [Cytophagaceae bacterium]
IDWTKSSPLALDGQHLIPIGNNEYRTENESYSKITGKNIQDWGPEVIEVQTKDGIIYEYGRAKDVGAYMQLRGYVNSGLGWRLCKVRDQFGNFIEYNYSYTTEGPIIIMFNFDYFVDHYYDHVLTSIEYGTSQNGQKSIIGKISFTYESRDDVLSGYVSGKIDKNRKILKNINIVSNGIKLQEYQLEHSFDGYYSRLININQTNSTGESFNPISFQWTTPQYSYAMPTTETGFEVTPKYNEWTRDGYNLKIFSKRTIGDINGDGLSDILVKAMYCKEVKTKKYWKYAWIVYRNAGISNSVGFKYVYEEEWDRDNEHSMFFLDMDKDGRDELYIFGGNRDAKTKLRGYKYTGSAFTLLSYREVDSNLININGANSNWPGGVKSVLPGEYLGDGKIRLAMFGDNNYFIGLTGIYNGLNHHFGGDSYSKLSITDMDGDRKQEFLYITNAGVTVYEIETTYENNNPVYSLNQHYSGTTIINKDKVHVGDFNGDGYTDLLVYDKSEKQWAIWKSSGSGFSTTTLSSDIKALLDARDVDDNLIVADIDEDGKSDIISAPVYFAPGSIASSRCKFNILVSKGNEFEVVVNKEEDLFFFIGFGRFKDANENGIYYDGSVTLKYIPLNRGIQYNKIVKITDSYNNVISLSYEKLRRPKLTSSSVIPLKSVNIGDEEPMYRTPEDFYVVKNVTGNELSLSYNFSKPQYHYAGKGFIGFLETEQTDNISLFKNTSKYEYHSNYGFLLPESTTLKTTGGTSLTTSNYYHTVVCSRTKYFFIRPDKTITTDHLKSTAITQTFSNYDSYGNPKTIKTDYGGGISETQTLTYIAKGSWCDNRVATSSITKQNASGSQTFATNYTWYDHGKLNTETVNAASADFKVVTAYEYDPFGNTKKITVSGGGKSRTRQMTYTPSGRFVATDKNVELNETVSYTYNEAKAQLLSQTDATGVTRYEYDGFGRPKMTTFPNKTRSASAYQWAGGRGPSNSLHYVYQETSGQSPVKTWYDKLGRELRRDFYGLNGQMRYITTQYNTKGELHRVSEPHTATSPSQWASTYTYDSYGRTSSVATPVGTTTYAYNGLTTTETSPRGTAVTQTNSAGQMIKSTINGKYVEYSYYPSGLTKSATPQGGTAVTFEYDLAGNRTKITDPDAGIIETLYNGLGEIVQRKQKVHTGGNDIVTTYGYKPSGLLDYENVNGRRTNYTYDTRNRLRTVSIAGVHSQTFDYDTFDRPVKVTETVEGSKTFVTETGYDALGRVGREVYPSGFAITNQYDRYGFLKSVTDDKGVKVWEALSANARGQLEQYKQGGRTTTLGYDSKGLPASMVLPGISNMNYGYDAKGNMQFRNDLVTNQKDEFQYDTANRLTGWKNVKSGNTAYIRTITYDDATGGIKTKNEVPYTMTYGEAGKPKHALTSIAGVPAGTAVPQNITYTDFNKMQSVTQGAKSHQLLYGVNSQRLKGTFKTSGATNLTRYYMGNYEEEVNSTGNIRKLHYISGGNGLAAIMVRNSGKDSLYYTYCDYQGNLLTVTDAAGTVKERYAYDPWGQRVNPASWGEKDTRTSFLFSRGYTMHEHLDEFGLINMNGRMYDPLVAQFLSPDPYVQAPGTWYNYNRYAYCMNNPLLYSDPSGEFFWAAIPLIVKIGIGIGAAAGAYTGYKIADAKGYDLGNLQTWGYMLGGAVIGGFSGYLGGTVAAGGGFMANTMGITSSSLFNSVGMSMLSGGILSPSISFGVASYDFGTGEWGYLGKRGNKWYQNVGYGMGALANLTDVVSLFGGGTNVSAITEKKDAISHAAVVGDDINVSVGPMGGGYFDKSQSLFGKIKNLFKAVEGDGDWANHSTDGHGWKLPVSNVNKNVLIKLSENLAAGKNFIGNSLQYSGIGYSCVSYASKALWAVGVPNIGLHPYIWQTSLMIRQFGIYSSPYLYQMPY